MNWALRYAPHTGFLPHDRTPLFHALAGKDPADHVRFAASQGMAGIMDAWANDRPPEQIHAIKAALEETGLVGGCVVSTPLARFMEPLWVAEAAEAEEELLGHVSHSLRVAGELGSKTLAVVLFEDGETAPAVQRRRAADRLRKAADITFAQGVTLAIEPIGGLPGMLLGSFAEAVDLVRQAAHPGVKLMFDTGHVAVMGNPVLETYVDAYDDIAVLQLADMPDRVEVGAGNLDLVSLLAHAIAKGYGGLVELEHFWSEPGVEGERSGLERLRVVDAQARAIAAQTEAAV